MCGIAGFCLSAEDSNNVNSRALATAMLLGIEHRGRDATGAAWFTAGGNVHINKTNETASKFVTKHLSVPKRARTVILHTRMSTKGSPKNNDNNHPIRSGNTVGVHNGWVNTDDDMFAMMPNVKRVAEVDSEAIFAALDAGTELHENKLTRLEFVYGNMAIAWLNDQAPGIMHLAKGQGSPLFIVGTKGGSTLFASTEETLAKAVEVGGFTVTWAHEAATGSYYKVEQGEIVALDTFEESARAWDIWSGYKYTPRTTVYNTWNAGTTVIRKPEPKFDMERSGIASFPTTKVDIHGEDAEFIDRRLFSLSACHAWDNEEWYEAYANRENNIVDCDNWSPRNTWLAGLLPGDKVECSNLFDGQSRVVEVVSLPSSFPHGKVLLRFTAATGVIGRTPDVFLVEKWVHDIHPVDNKYPEGTGRPSWLVDEDDLSEELLNHLALDAAADPLPKREYTTTGKNGTGLRLVEGSNGMVVATSAPAGELVAVD